MFSITMKKSLALVMSAMIALSVAAVAAETAAGAAARASDEIDRELDSSAGQLTRELDQATKQIHESERLGQPSSVPNTYGSAAGIDSEIDKTAAEANAELRRSFNRDNYALQRRELESTRSLYYPGSADYDRFTAQIEKLDRDFANSESQFKK